MKRSVTPTDRRAKRLLEFFESAIIVLAALLAFTVSLLDLFGILDSVPAITSRVPILTLLLLSLALGVSFILRTRIDVIEDIRTGLIETKQDISLVLSKNVLSDIEGSLGRIDTDLRLVFESDIRELLGSIVLAIQDKSIRITELERYRYYYIRALANFPHSTIMATSIPSSLYFWKNPAVENAIAAYIKQGGTFKRIFFLDHAEDVLRSEVQEILRKQLEIKVEAYIVPVSAVPPQLATLFVVESRGRIGWQVYTDDNRRITSVVATTDQNTTRRFLELFEKLLQLDETRLVTKEDIIEPAVATLLDTGDNAN